MVSSLDGDVVDTNEGNEGILRYEGGRIYKLSTLRFIPIYRGRSTQGPHPPVY